MRYGVIADLRLVQTALLQWFICSRLGNLYDILCYAVIFLLSYVCLGFITTALCLWWRRVTMCRPVQYCLLQEWNSLMVVLRCLVQTCACYCGYCLIVGLLLLSIGFVWCQDMRLLDSIRSVAIIFFDLPHRSCQEGNLRGVSVCFRWRRSFPAFEYYVAVVFFQLTVCIVV